MHRIAWIVSRIFDPILILGLTLFFATSWASVYAQEWQYLLPLFIVDAVLPAIVLFYFIQKGRVLSGWDVRDRTERVPLFVFVVWAHLAGVLWVWYLSKHPLTEYMAAFWVMTVVYAIITNYWKISVHSGVISSMVTFLVLTHGKAFAVLYALVLLVIWARVYGKYHRLGQAIVGGVTPIILLPLCFWWFGIL